VSEPSDLRMRRREQLRGAGVYLVTEEALSGGRTSAEIAQAALEAGVRVIQVREKAGTTRHALQVARTLRGLTRGRGALLLVNDRLDLAMAAEADGAARTQQSESETTEEEGSGS